MSTKTHSEPPEGFTRVAPDFNNNSDDAEWLDGEDGLEPGEWSQPLEYKGYRDNCGENDNRVYRFSAGPGQTVCVWAKDSLTRDIIERAQLGKDDVVAVGQLESTFENEHGEFHEWAVAEPEAGN